MQAARKECDGSSRQEVPQGPGGGGGQAAATRLPEAVAAVAKTAFAKFDETVEVAMRLGVDPKHADQMVRGTVVLPHGLGGKSKRVLVIASGEKLKEAQDAGADYVGGDDMVAEDPGRLAGLRRRGGDART